MPSVLEDPTAPTNYRASGQGPFPTSGNPQIPSSIFPRPITLRDRVTIATLIPFFSPDAVPPRLLSYLWENFNREIEDGNTYPMLNALPLSTFGPYWFGNFGAVMVLGDIGGIEAVNEMERNGADWSKLCLGTFYVKPNYPGRSSHVCNGGFVVTPAARNKGVGKSMGQCYLDWAPQLGYTYSVFNLVYESNTASTRIWDSLGFKRIGRVPGCGNLRSYDEPVDAIIYGRDLKAEEGNVGNEERFDKIRYYLRHSLYPQGADRSEKSRLRSAATHYKLIPAQDGIPEKLMLKDKEVISDPAQQYDIAKNIHLSNHGGINKTTAVIAMKYHWVRIKETVSHVIKNCIECKDTNKAPVSRSDGTRSARSKTLDNQSVIPDIQLKQNQTVSQEDLQQAQMVEDLQRSHLVDGLEATQISDGVHQSQLTGNDFKTGHLTSEDFRQVEESLQLHGDGDLQDADSQMVSYDDMAIDPQIMEQIQAQLAGEYDPSHHHATQLADDYGGSPQHQVFVQPGMSQYADTSHLTQAHTHQTAEDFVAAQQHMNDHNAHFLSAQAAAMMGHHTQQSPDHVMSGSDDPGGPGTNGDLSSMEQIRQVLQMEYLSSPQPPDGHVTYKQ